MRSLKTFVLESDLKEFLSGKKDTLKTYSGSELHHQFGDFPEMCGVIEVQINIKKIA